MGRGVVGWGGGGIGDGVWCAVKDGEGSKVTVYREDFGEEVGGVDEAGKEDKTEELLAALPEPVETHVYRLGLLRPNRRSRKTDGAFVVDE